MRVVTYARVSHRKQADEGQSLVNQDRKFQRWKDLGGHTIVHSYEEQASASSIRKRRLFAQMLDDLDVTRPDCIVVDSMDRFSRNLEDAFEVLKELRKRGINVWPLEWERDKPPDIITYDSEDYIRARTQIIEAQAELSRIRTRMKRSYKGREERGATKTNRPPFGLRKNGDQLDPDPQTAWIVTEAEDRALAGEHFLDIVRWVQSLDPQAWSHNRSLQDAFANLNYVTAGLRSVDRHRALIDLLDVRRARYGQRRVYENEFTGVFLCGLCADEGRPNALMTGTHRQDPKGKGYRYPVVFCQERWKDCARTVHFTVAQSKIETAWWRYVDDITADPALLQRWAHQHSESGAERERQLTQRLARIDQQAASLKNRRDRAFDLLTDASAAIQRQARKALEDVERDEMELAIQRQAVVAELAAEPRRVTRDPDLMRAELRRYREVYEGEDARSRNELNRAICALIGSHPKVYRFGGANDAAVVEWPELDTLRRVSARKSAFG